MYKRKTIKNLHVCFNIHVNAESDVCDLLQSAKNKSSSAQRKTKTQKRQTSRAGVQSRCDGKLLTFTQHLSRINPRPDITSRFFFPCHENKRGRQTRDESIGKHKEREDTRQREDRGSGRAREETKHKRQRREDTRKLKDIGNSRGRRREGGIGHMIKQGREGDDRPCRGGRTQ